MINNLLAYVHDTELWASYLPRIPRVLYLLALLGVALMAPAFWTLQNGQPALAWVALGLGTLLVLPVILAGLFALWKWRYRSNLRRQMLDFIPWRGDEQVLDVGCGSGLLLNGAARRLTTGKAVGMDLWTAHSGGGDVDLLWQNARQENVADRIEFREADARNMPFESETFDVVVSSGVVHHISRTHADFEQALHEMARVLKPGGQIVIGDVAHIVNACAARLRSAGLECEVVEAGRFLDYEQGIVFGKKAG